MKLKSAALVAGLSLIICFSAFISEDDPIALLLKKLEAFTIKYPQEKIHLHLDKPYYAVGDDIWFNAYVINAKTGGPTDISNVIYVELINERDSISRQLKLAMKGGIAWGEFKLSDSLNEGNYRIRAYTQWMRNAGDEFFYDKTIKVGNTWANRVATKASTMLNDQNLTNTIQFISKSNIPYVNAPVSYAIQLGNSNLSSGKTVTNESGIIKITTPANHQGGRIIATIVLPDKSKIVKTIPIKSIHTETDVQFFPEGGNLVVGIPSKIAVKAVNRNGLGENITAIISDSDGLEVISFETTYLGMGSFSLTPMEGKSYKAKVKFANGAEQSIILPKAEKSGYVMSVNNTDTAKISVKILLTTDLLNKGDLTLIAQRNGSLFTTIKVPVNKQVTTISIPKINIPSGIVQLTLFNSDHIPVLERLAFVNNSFDKIELAIETIKSAYNKREKVNFAVSANSNFKPVQGSFSIAVTNEDIVTPDVQNESNILTGLLLTSDLIGYVENPNHYFLKNDAKTRSELDNLLLTQGWRRINWKQLSDSDGRAPNFLAEKSLKISGVVTTNSNKPIVKGTVTLLSSSKGMFVTTTETDDNGRFAFDEMSFGDSLKFVVQASTKEDKKNVKVKLDLLPDQAATGNKNTGDIELNVNTSMAKYLSESDRFFEEQVRQGFLTKTNLLKTVNITEKRIRREDSASVSSANYNGRGKANYIVTAKDLQNTFSLSQYIAQGRILGVADSGGYAWNTRIGPLGGGGSDGEDLGKPPAVPKFGVVLDGMMLENLSLDEIQVNEVESMEVLISPGYTAAYGASGKYGVLIISMKRGSGRKLSEINAPGLAIISPKGYDIPRQFYSPKYDVSPNIKPDLRTTVYWNPQVVTDVNGRANVVFFNNDQTGNYRIVIEGIDADGNLARKVVTYQVK